MTETKQLTLNAVTCSRNNLELFLPVTFSLAKGEIIHIQGPNGIGKTTLLRSIATLVPPARGEICWSSEPIQNCELYKSQLVFLPHHSMVKASLTVYENLKWSPSLASRLTDQQIESILEQLALTTLRNRLGGTLSSGQKQRVSLAKLCLTRAKIWIMDEPFNTLDSKGIAMVESLMQQHLACGGMIVFTSHQATSKFSTLKCFNLEPLSEVM